MEKTKNEYRKPEMAFIDMEKHTVTASPEMVSRISPKIDQIVQEIAYERSAANPIKENALIDKEVLPAKYFAEDDTMRNIGNCSEYVSTMMICVDSFENGVAQGRLHSYYLKDPIPFFSLDQLLFALDDVMDQAGTPQAWTEKRSFAKTKNKRKEVSEKEEAAQSIPPYYDLQTMRPKSGRIASFYIRVYSRMHSSMQGVVMIAGSSNQTAFRSELELLYLIREGLSLPTK